VSEGRVYLVGAGPGDPGLLTLRGRHLLTRADVVVYDYLVSERLLELAAPDAERIYVGKRASDHTLSQEEINRLLVDRARDGATVVRLKGGDPYVFGRGAEEALALVEAGVDFEVVPGVTAAVAAANYAGIPVTHRDMASQLGLVTGHEAADKPCSALDWNVLGRWKGTLVFYMGMKNLRSICKKLIDEGMAGDMPAAVIRWGTTPHQQVVTATVGTLPDRAEQAGLGPPALVIIGRVVALREKLAWFERRPLFGRRIVVTRPRRQAGELTSRLEALGAEVIELPAIRIEPPTDPALLRSAVSKLSEFDWIVFTSVNGVEAFFAALAEAGRDSRALAANKVCAVGPSTAGRLADFGIRVDAQPARYTGAAITETLASLDTLSGARILCPRAENAPGDLIEALSARGAAVEDVAAYRTVPEPLDAARASELFERREVHWITFTSSSTVKNFFSVVDAELIRSSSTRIASIGPVTSATLGRFGFRPDIQADEHTVDGLVESIVGWEKSAGEPRCGPS